MSKADTRSLICNNPAKIRSPERAGRPGAGGGADEAAWQAL